MSGVSPIVIGGIKGIVKSRQFLPYPILRAHLPSESLKSFGDIYFDVLNSFEEKDVQYLE
jgi:hypothetical protein